MRNSGGGKKRIVILCEGDTEVNAVEYFIRPQWNKDGLSEIGIRGIKLLGKINNIFNIVPNYAKEGETKAIFTLIDLYGTKDKKLIYAKYDEVSRKVEKLKEWLKNQYDESVLVKFHPHVSVHETEAWFLADEKALSDVLKTKIKQFPNPEQLDFLEHPSKRINILFNKYLKRRYIKGGLTGDDRKMFEKMSLEETAKRCPYLKAFYEDLQKVGRQILLS